MHEPTNLVRLSPSRKPLADGDVFTLQIKAVGHLFGRVINAAAEAGPMGPGANLVYIYDTVSDTPDPPSASLTRDSLLVAPLFINRLPWSRGYFETVASMTLGRDDVLAVHYFRRFNGQVLDEAGAEVQVPRRSKVPVGQWGLNSYLTVDDAVSDALGIERATNE